MITPLHLINNLTESPVLTTMVRQVQPLRISKGTPSSTPLKMSAAASRPLSEIGSTERRRNSPSYNQATRVSALLSSFPSGHHRQP